MKRRVWTNDEGYTLAECLIALFIVGLALGGLSMAMRSIGRQQLRTVETVRRARDLRALHQGLDRFLAGQGPFIGPSAELFSGTSKSFRFRCGPVDDCRVWLTSERGGMALHLAGLDGQQTLPMDGARSAQFVYAGARTIGPSWPADEATVQPLKSIGLMAETDVGSIPIADVSLWIDQSPYCDFDPILKDCRR